MFPIIGKRFTPEEFAEHVDSLPDNDFIRRVDRVVVHNTAIPSLAQRPNGFTAQHMKNLQSYYAGKSWPSGPHLFIDDLGIWAFSPLEKPGTHSPSWNAHSWGVEMLGNYEAEPFESGRGAKVASLAAAAVAILLRKADLPLDGDAVRFHREDPKTTHRDCPGKNVVKARFLEAVGAVSLGFRGWSVVGLDGEEVIGNVETGMRGTGIVRVIAEHLGATVDADPVTRTIRLTRS